MECKVTCFERAMYSVKPLDEEDKWAACEFIRIILKTDYGFRDFLDYGVEKGCFTKSQAKTLYDGIVMWEDFTGNYYEEDKDKLCELYEHMGITKEHVMKYQEETNEKDEKDDIER